MNPILKKLIWIKAYLLVTNVLKGVKSGRFVCYFKCSSMKLLGIIFG